MRNALFALSGRAGRLFLVWLIALFAAAAQARPPVHLKYPVVMVHGIFAKESANPGAYFRGVPKRFAELGIPVSFPSMGFNNGIEDRADRLAAHLRATWPTGKVNLIAHSIGGLAARDAIVRLGLGDRIASLTTVSTPHHGTTVADWVVRLDPWSAKRVCLAADVHPDAMRDLTTASVAAFNRRTPDDPRVAYFSLGGAQVWYKIGPLLQPFTWLIRLTARVRAGHAIDPDQRARLERQPWGRDVLTEVDRTAGEVARSGIRPEDRAAYDADRGANDGVVPLLSSPWATSWGTVDMDHLDEIGWGTNGEGSADFYEFIARSLEKSGF